MVGPRRQPMVRFWTENYMYICNLLDRNGVVTCVMRGSTFFRKVDSNVAYSINAFIHNALLILPLSSNTTKFHDHVPTFILVTTLYININVLLTVCYPMRIYIGYLDAIC